MQDILDSQWDILSTPNTPLSRTSSMKKINKKQNVPSVRPQSKAKIAGRDSFDDLLNSVLNKDSKHLNINENNTPASTNRMHYDFLDAKYQEAKSPIKSPTQGYQQNNGAPRTSIGNNYSIGQIAIQDHGINQHFGTTQKSIFNPSRAVDSFVSSRNMKPPLRPKENFHTQSITFGSSEADIVIPEEDPALTNSSNFKGNRSNSLKKRSSIDERSQLSDDVLPLGGRAYGGTIQSVQFDTIKEDVFPNIHKSQSCVLTEPKNENDHSNSGSNFFMARGKLQSKSQSLKIGLQEEKKKQQSIESRSQDFKHIITEYQRQIEGLKATYQSQINHLQECLNKQIAENRSLRDMFMKESRQLIEEERNRSAKIHQEQISRLKDIFNWQQKKQEDAYQLEISSLKSSLNMINDQHQWLRTAQGPVQHNIEFLQCQLQSKQQKIDAKLKSVQQRQIELEKRESELNLRMKREQDKIRQEDKRLTQMQYDFKTMMMQEKKALSQEKQELAMELGSMESQFMKRKQQLALKERQVKLQKEAIEHQKKSMEMFNAQAFSKHKQSIEDIQRQKERIKDLQIELIQKIRVVEMKAKEISLQCNNHEQLPFKRNNNWLDHSFSKLHSAQSVQKKLHNSSSTTSMAKTKQRFHLLEKNTKTRLNLTAKQNKKIDLSNYLSRMQNNRVNMQA